MDAPPRTFTVEPHCDAPRSETDNLPCPGMMVRWEAGSIWDTYPYHQHASRNIGWTPIGYGQDDRSLLIRSDGCTAPKTGSDGYPCNACLHVEHSSNFRKFVERSFEVKDHTPHTYLNPKQLIALIGRIAAKSRKLRTEVCNSNTSLVIATDFNITVQGFKPKAAECPTSSARRRSPTHSNPAGVSRCGWAASPTSCSAEAWG